MIESTVVTDCEFGLQKSVFHCNCDIPVSRIFIKSQYLIGPQFQWFNNPRARHFTCSNIRETQVT